jgi:choice-of-anchor A domain-containing protein
MKLHNLNRSSKSLLAGVALAVTSLVCAGHSTAAFVDLGAAGGYAALILPGGSINMDINGGSAIVGDAGVTAGSHLDLGSGAKVGPLAGTGTVVDGTIWLDPNGATVKLDNQPANTVGSRDLSQAITDAMAANQAAAALTATQMFGTLDITNAQTITGNGGLNVIDLNSLKLHGSGTLTLSGSASDFFVFNITGSYSQSGPSSVLLSGGVLAQNVLWNFIGSGQGAQIATGMNGVAQGTFLSPFRDFSITDTTLFGSVIADGDLKIGSQALVIQPVPEVTPASVLIGFLGLVVAVSSRRILCKRMRPAAIPGGK